MPSTPTSKPDEACALYVRRSSAGGNGKNHSLAEQKAEAQALAARHGLTVVHVYAEKEGTGASRHSHKKRPEWDAALGDLEAGDRFRTLIVYALDRADRRGAAAIGALLDRHADGSRRILGTDGLDTSDTQRRLEFIVRAEIAREEAENLSRRVSRTKRRRRASGRWLGGRPPYGLAVGENGRLVRDAETAPTARRIADALLAGETLWSVVGWLNAEGVESPEATRLRRRAARNLREAAQSETPREEAEALETEAAEFLQRADASRWRVPSLAATVKAPAWAGLQSIRRRNPETGAWAYIADVYRDAETGEPVSVGEGIVTRQERALLLAALASRTVERLDAGRERRAGLRVSAVGYLLSEVLRCETCGARTGTAGGDAHRSYRCASAAQGAGRCKGFTAPLEALDAYVAARIRTRLGALEPEPGEAWHPALLAAAKAWAGEASPEARAARQDAAGLLAEAEADDARVKALAIAGALLPEEAAVERRKTGARIVKAREALDALGSIDPDPGALLDAATTAEAWEGLDDVTRRRVVEAVVVRVTVKKAAARGVRFRPEERVSISWRED